MSLGIRFDASSGPSGQSREVFSQQGSVDWVALSSGVFSFSLGMLQRLSGAKLDAYTVSVGYVLGGQFRLSRNGRLNIQKALDDMKEYAGLQNVLYFGFGMKHPARAIGSTEQGSTLVALCAALAECLPHNTAAEILNDMVSQESNLEVTPSVGEWLALVKSCAGILSTTMFSQRAEKLMGLGTDDKLAEPTDIATVLNAIAKITRLEWVSITVHGGKEARFIGALAEWLFGLTVTIENDQNEVVYTNCPDGQISQVNICSQSRLHSSNKNYRAPKMKSKSLEIADRTFYIQAVTELGVDGSDKSYCGGTMATPSMNGRVLWENCLSTVFGVLFEELMKRPERVADAITSAARIFSGIATAEEGVPIGILETSILYVEASYGAGYIHTLLQVFPELSVIKQRLIQGSGMDTFKSATSKYRVSLKSIKDDCGCNLCIGEPDFVRGKESNCQAVLIELIIRVGRIMSVTECAEGLYPKFTGLRKLYNMRADEIRANKKTYFQDPPGVHRYRLEDLRPPNKAAAVTKDNFEALMEHALCLFTGRTNDDLKTNFPKSPAVSVEGICVYLHVLREIPDTPEMFAMLHVCPGQILHHGKKFTQLTDRQLFNRPGDNVEMHKGDAVMICALQGVISSVKLALRETVEQLFLHFELFYRDGEPTGFQLRPFTLCENMLYNYKRLSCSHSNASEADWGNGPEDIPEFRIKIDPENRYHTWKIMPSLLGRCAIVSEYHGMVAHSSLLVVQDTECIACCQKMREDTAERYKAEELLVVAKPDPNRPPWQEPEHRKKPNVNDESPK